MPHLGIALSTALVRLWELRSVHGPRVRSYVPRHPVCRLISSARAEDESWRFIATQPRARLSGFGRPGADPGAEMGVPLFPEQTGRPSCSRGPKSFAVPLSSRKVMHALGKASGSAFRGSEWPRSRGRRWKMAQWSGLHGISGIPLPVSEAQPMYYKTERVATPRKNRRRKHPITPSTNP